MWVNCLVFSSSRQMELGRGSVAKMACLCVSLVHALLLLGASGTREAPRASPYITVPVFNRRCCWFCLQGAWPSLEDSELCQLSSPETSVPGLLYWLEPSVSFRHLPFLHWHDGFLLWTPLPEGLFCHWIAQPRNAGKWMPLGAALNQWDSSEG